MNEESVILQISVFHENKINESPRRKGIIPHKGVRHRPGRQLAPLVDDLGHQLSGDNNVSLQSHHPFFKKPFALVKRQNSTQSVIMLEGLIACSMYLAMPVTTAFVS